MQYLATRGYSKTLLMEEVLQRYLAEELAERKKIHEEEMKELSKLVFIVLVNSLSSKCSLAILTALKSERDHGPTPRFLVVVGSQI